MKIKSSDFKAISKDRSIFKDKPIVKMKESRIPRKHRKPLMARVKSGKNSWLSRAIK